MRRMIAAPAPPVAADPATVIAQLGGGSWAGTTRLPRSPRWAGVICAPARAALDGGFAWLTRAGASELTRSSSGRPKAAGTDLEPSPREAGADMPDAAVPVPVEPRSLGACDGGATTGGAAFGVSAAVGAVRGEVDAARSLTAAGFQASALGGAWAVRDGTAASTIV